MRILIKPFKKNSSVKLIVGCGLLGTVLAVRDCLLLDFPWPIVLLIYMGTIVALDYYDAITFFCFSFPMMTGLPANYVYITTVAVLLLKGPKKISIYKILPIFLFTLIEFIGMLYVPEASILQSIGAVAAVSILFLLVRYDDGDRYFNRHIFAYAVGITLVEFIMIYSTFRDNSISFILMKLQQGTGRLGYMIRDVGDRLYCTYDPNALAYFAATAFFGCFIQMNRQKRHKPLLIALVVMQVITGFLTMSRSWVVVMILTMLVYVVLSRKTVKGMIKTVCVVVISALGVMWFLTSNPELLEGFLSRFTDETVSSGNGRIELFSMYLDAWISDFRLFLMGSGVVNYVTAYDIGEAATHNGTLQIFLCYGFLGGMTFLTLLLAPVIRRYNKREKLCWLPMIAVFLFVQTLQFVTPYVQMYPYLIAAYAIYAGSQGTVRIKRNTV